MDGRLTVWCVSPRRRYGLVGGPRTLQSGTLTFEASTEAIYRVQVGASPFRLDVTMIVRVLTAIVPEESLLGP